MHYLGPRRDHKVITGDDLKLPPTIIGDLTAKEILLIIQNESCQMFQVKPQKKIIATRKREKISFNYTTFD